jgi:hypothetical protein
MKQWAIWLPVVTEAGGAHLLRHETSSQEGHAEGDGDG